MSKNTELICCGKKIKNGDVWFLQDFNGFVERRLYTAKCPYCGDDVVSMTEVKNDKNGKQTIYTRNSINGIEAVKILYRERKRKLAMFPKVRTNCLHGWVYGVNTEIKNKKGEVVQIRQYASDFKGNKALVKAITN